MRNPYICGGWVTGSHFYGHQGLVREIVGGQFSRLYVMGGRRSGKTSVLRRAEEVCLDEGKPCLFLDLQTTGRSWEGLFQVLRVELRYKARHGEHPFSADLLAAPDLFSLVGELIERVEVQGAELLLLLDEAEVLLEMAASFPEPLARLWRMWHERPAVQIVVAASRALSGIDPLLRPQLPGHFWAGFQLRCLACLNDAASEALIQQRNSPPPVRVAPQAIRQVKEATGRQPYLLQLLCQRLYQSDHSLRPLTDSDLEVDELLGSLFRADYRNLRAEERELLWLIAEGHENGGDLQAQAGLKGRHLVTCLRWLECLGYIHPPEHARAEGHRAQTEGRYSVANGFLTSWLASRRAELRGMRVSKSVLGELRGMKGGFHVPC